MQDIDIKSAVGIALSEDLNGQTADHGDITANLIPVTQNIIADIITREDCVLAGAAWVTETLHSLTKIFSCTGMPKMVNRLRLTSQ